MKKVICFGEIMARLNPEGYYRFLQAEKLEISYAGSESNVAMSLAYLGIPASYVTKLPNHDLAKAAAFSLQKYGVDISQILFNGERMGLFFLEKGASQRPSQLIYDRKNSAFSLAQPEDFDWEAVFEGADWFHFSGITPALSDSMAEICFQACQKAKEKGLTVSCDLNYRQNLWSLEKAGKVMKGLMPYVDVLIANSDHAASVLGVKAPDEDVIDGELNDDGYKYISQCLMEQYNLKTVAITIRRSYSAGENGWGALLYDGKEFSFSKRYRINIVDRVGGGDAFTAALIYSLMHQFSCCEAVDFSAAASCLKHSIEHDYNLISVEEIRKLMNGDGTGRFQR